MRMFPSLRPYRTLREEQTQDGGKCVLSSCCTRQPPPSPSSASIVASPPNAAVLPPKGTSTHAPSCPAPALGTSFGLHSLRAAWRSLSSLSGLSAPRLPHLERAASTPTAPAVASSQTDIADARYTHFPPPVAAPPSKSLAQCLLRRRPGKARSENSLHRVCVGNVSTCTPSSTVFSRVQLSSAPLNPAIDRSVPPQRSRSLERTRFDRPTQTRSLERNHKFRVHLRPLAACSSVRDFPPDHPAPPPPDGCLGAGTHSSSAMEGAQGGSFINKPPRGWLHADQQLADEGICYGVRYIGALEVNTSMKSLNFDTRSLIAKECISKVCEAAGLKTVDRRRRGAAASKGAPSTSLSSASLGRVLGDRPLMEHAGANVTLTITSSALKLTTLETGFVVASHEMPNISFASGGDPDTLDFIAYVARDSRMGRACFVLECGGGLAQDVITTIGQAFELRFKEYLKRVPATGGSVQTLNPSASGPVNVQNVGGSHTLNNATAAGMASSQVQYTNVKAVAPPSDGGSFSVNGGSLNLGVGSCHNKYDREYYNDLPGKVPPDLAPPPVPPLPQYSAAAQSAESVNNISAAKSIPKAPLSVAGGDNLIDLSCEAATPQSPPSASLRREPEYVNEAVIKQKVANKDPFDMQPFSMQLNQMGGASASNTDMSAANPPSGGSMMPGKTLPLSQRLELQKEPWFHGPISRKDAELMLKQDGDFLVRESPGTAGQYVLTGIQNGVKKHLLLVDPEGVVRTKSRTFTSVSHLICFHGENELPIVSAESALLLRRPVTRPTAQP